MNTGVCADPEPLLSPPQIQLLRSPCVSLIVGPGLSSQHLVQICTLTSLTYLKLQITKTAPETMMTGMFMDSLTKLQVLNKLKLSFPPRLPLLLPKLPSLQSLTIGPWLPSQHHLQICTLTGLTYLQLQFTRADPESMTQGMLLDSLTNLQVLNELRLSCPPRLPLLLSKLASLESLTVAVGTPATLDMSALTQVYSVRLGQRNKKKMRVPVVLPTGPKARLSALAIHTSCEIQNLHKANLTQIEISGRPGIMHAVSWPTALPHLQHLTVCNVTPPYMLPHKWQHYTQLRCLCLPKYQGFLPLWFSNLQQLKTLSMPDAQMEGIPECLFQLSKLKRLELSRFQGLLTMSVVKLADLLQLTYLEFQKFKHTLLHYEQAVLLDLEIALRKRKLKLKREHPDEWTYVLDTCQ